MEASNKPVIGARLWTELRITREHERPKLLMLGETALSKIGAEIIILAEIIKAGCYSAVTIDLILF